MTGAARQAPAASAQARASAPDARARSIAATIDARARAFARPSPHGRSAIGAAREAAREPRQLSAEQLAASGPAVSAALGPARWQIWAGGLAVAAALLLAVFAPAIARAALGAATLGVVGVLASFRAACCLTPPRPPARGAWRGPLPVYTIIAPLYREANVLPDLVEALFALDYPAELLDIKLAIEADDAETLAVARALQLDARFEIVAVPAGAPRTKPRALNAALASARGAFLAIFDAEDRPAPNQLKAALDAFARGGARMGCAQAPLGWYNARENWLTRQFALEYAAQFHVILPALARWGWAPPLGGTSNHFRIEALNDVGGWDPYNVTEDADIGYRLAARGWGFDVLDAPTEEEATAALGPWTRQRARWIKGFLQTWATHMRNPARLARGAGVSGQASLQLLIGLSALSSLAHAPLALGALTLALASLASPAPNGVDWTALALIAAGYGAAGASAWLGLRRAGLKGLNASIATMPAYWLLHSPAAARAVWDYARRPFHWHKTTHGVTRLAAAAPTAPAISPAPRACAASADAATSRAERQSPAPASNTRPAPPETQASPPHSW